MSILTNLLQWAASDPLVEPPSPTQAVAVDSALVPEFAIPPSWENGVTLSDIANPADSPLQQEAAQEVLDRSQICSPSFENSIVTYCSKYGAQSSEWGFSRAGECRLQLQRSARFFCAESLSDQLLSWW